MNVFFSNFLSGALFVSFPFFSTNLNLTQDVKLWFLGFGQYILGVRPLHTRYSQAPFVITTKFQCPSESQGRDGSGPWFIMKYSLTIPCLGQRALSIANQKVVHLKHQKTFYRKWKLCECGQRYSVQKFPRGLAKNMLNDFQSQNV